MGRNEVQQDALDIAISNDRCGLGISMGVGKTRVALQHMIKNFHPLAQYLVVAPKKTIFKAWSDEIDKIGEGDLLKYITFTTYLSINKHNPNEYDIVYLDECHSLLDNHENFLSSYTGKILGLTGTPPKRKGTEKYRMVQKYCPMKYNFSVDQASDNQILNQYKIIIHHLRLSGVKSLEKNNKKTGSKWYTSEIDDYTYSTNRLEEADTMQKKKFFGILRMKSMMNYSTKEHYAKGMLKHMGDKCIVFANTQKQADLMCSHSYHSGNKNSQDNLELFSDGRIDQLSCVLQLSEGVSIPGLKQGIIMHAYGNERKTAQRIGRLLRLNPSETATCHILCYKDTIDEKWVTQALAGFDQSKIEFYNPLNN